MRSIRMLAATTVILTGAWACGGDGGGVEPNNDPVANFTGGPCTVGVGCSFADLSTDDGTITTRSWNFGDGTAPVENPGLNPSHTYTVAGTYNVSLTVTDNGGKTNTKTLPITATGGGTTTNTPPTAAFTPPTCTVNVACLFTDASTDTDGQVVGWSWNFGDGTAPVTDRNPSHTFATAGTYQVSLTVTDEDGAASTAVTQPVTVSTTAPVLNCSTAGTVVNCNLDITQRSTVKLTLTQRECELGGNRISIAQPVVARQTAWFNTCFSPAVIPAEYTILDNAGAPMVFEAGTMLQVRFTQGTAGAGSPLPGAPAAEFDGSFPSWTINIEDGGNPATPDFNDVVLSVVATPQ
jgi:PKD repeat protein